MAAQKVSRKELLKEPDEFLTFSAKAIRYAEENRSAIILGAVLVVVAVAVAVGAFSYMRYKSETSHELFLKGLEKYRAVMASGEPTNEQLDGLLKEFEAVARDYGSYLGGELSLLYSGHTLYKKKDYKGALARYEKMKSTSVVEKGLESLLKYHLASAYFALENYDAANKLFDQLAKDPESPYKREAYATIAEIFEAQGKRKEAKQAYEQYLKMFPKAPDAAYVKGRIAALSSRG